MLLAHETPPAMITGIRPTAEMAVRDGFSGSPDIVVGNDKKPYFSALWVQFKFTLNESGCLISPLIC